LQKIIPTAAINEVVRDATKNVVVLAVACKQSSNAQQLVCAKSTGAAVITGIAVQDVIPASPRS